MLKTDTEAVRCPNCSSTDVRYSEKPRILDLLYRVIGMDAVRCRHCRIRFYSRILED